MHLYGGQPPLSTLAFAHFFFVPFESLGSVVVPASPEHTEEQGPLLGRPTLPFSSLV